MKWLFTLALVFAIGFIGVEGVICRRPPVGRYVLGKDATDSVSLIKAYCVGMKNKNTRFWMRGISIKENCAIIRPMAAIATFAGPNNKYSGGAYKHAAIFLSCDTDGIWVFDQWSGSRGVKFRKIIFSESSDQHDAASFYTIVVT